MKLTLDIVINDIIDYLKKSNEKFILVDDFPIVLTNVITNKYGSFSYTSEIGIALKKMLKESNEIEIFKARNDVHNSNGAFTMTAGEYFVLKGMYKDVVDMKEKHRIIPMIFKRRKDVVAWENGELDIDEY